MLLSFRTLNPRIGSEFLPQGKWIHGKAMRSCFKLRSIMYLNQQENRATKSTVTVIGEADPVCIIKQVRKFRKSANITSIGAPEPEKKKYEKNEKDDKKEEKKDVTCSLPIASPLPSASSQPTSSNSSPSTPSAASLEPVEVPVPDPVGDVSAGVDSLPSSASHTSESGATVSTQPTDDSGSLPAGSGPSSGNSAGPQVDDSSVGSVVTVPDSIAASRPKRNRIPNPKYFNQNFVNVTSVHPV
nr:heavy metal-associated isoprenylated plant protein 2-like [Ipomoea batatas]